MKSFILMLTFLTRIPYPVRFDFNTDDFAKGLLYLPVIGLIIGLPMYLFSAYSHLSHPFLTSFLLLLIYIATTGGLHLDGLADYFDGVFSGRQRDRILEIMKDSSIGTFGVVGLCLYFLGMFVGLMTAGPLVLLLMPVVARVVGLSFCAFGDYPRQAGMGQALVAYGKWYHGLSALVLMMILLYVAGTSFLIAGSITLVTMGLFYIRTVQVVGGITGDVIGAAIEITQVLWLLIFSLMGGL